MVLIQVRPLKRRAHHLNACGPIGEPRRYRSSYGRLKRPLLSPSSFTFGVRGPSSRYRSVVVRLSSGCSAFELRKEIGTPWRTRTADCLGVNQMPLPLGEWSMVRMVGVEPTMTPRFKRDRYTNSLHPRDAHSSIRTNTVHALRVATPTNWSIWAKWYATSDSNREPSRSKRDTSTSWASGTWCSLQVTILSLPLTKGLFYQ